MWSRKCWDIEENVRVFLKKLGEFQEKVGELLKNLRDNRFTLERQIAIGTRISADLTIVEIDSLRKTLSIN